MQLMLWSGPCEDLHKTSRVNETRTRRSEVEAWTNTGLPSGRLVLGQYDTCTATVF